MRSTVAALLVLAWLILLAAAARLAVSPIAPPLYRGWAWLILATAAAALFVLPLRKRCPCRRNGGPCAVRVRPRPATSPAAPGDPRPPRTPETHPADPEQLVRLLQGRMGGLSLRDLCAALWPDLRWCALYPNEDDASQRVRGSGLTAAQQVQAQLITLIAEGRVCLGDPRRYEVDQSAAIVYEALPAAPAPAPAPPSRKGVS